MASVLESATKSGAQREGASDAELLGAARAAFAILGSLAERIKRFEGALLAINLSLLAVASGTLAAKAQLAALSVLTLAALYGFNDFWDAKADIHNPRKQRWLVELYLAQRTATAAALVGLHLLCALLALTAGGTSLLLAVVALFAVNVSYSLVLKGVPVVDVIWCGIWGATYTAMIGTGSEILVLVGIMTAVCHVYQTLVDRSVDARNGIGTIAARTATAVPITLLVLCGFLAVVLSGYFQLPWGGALSAFTPVAPYYLVASRNAAWLLTKVYFGGLWLVILSRLDVGV
ncbi:MAG: UbiA family prenyltransferase [Candidatus Binatia bacterium]|nr:UbiA family prenyltransferase [Candidatus Binatia bacterium]